MNDLIKREDAIAKFKKTCTSESIDKNGIKRGEIHTAMTYEGIIKIIEALPSAEPERMTGEWIWTDGVRCSRCYYKLQTTGIPQYCPNCGCYNGGE